MTSLNFSPMNSHGVIDSLLMIHLYYCHNHRRIDCHWSKLVLGQKCFIYRKMIIQLHIKQLGKTQSVQSINQSAFSQSQLNNQSISLQSTNETELLTSQPTNPSNIVSFSCIRSPVSLVQLQVIRAGGQWIFDWLIDQSIDLSFCSYCVYRSDNQLINQQIT